MQRNLLVLTEEWIHEMSYDGPYSYKDHRNRRIEHALQKLERMGISLLGDREHNKETGIIRVGIPDSMSIKDAWKIGAFNNTDYPCGSISEPQTKKPTIKKESRWDRFKKLFR